MSESPMHILSDVIIILSAAVSIVVLFHRVKISSLLGYFVSGAVIGAHGLGLVQANSAIEILGEFGIVFLLFLIGLELTFARLVTMKRHVFGLGGIQVVLTTFTITMIASYYGLELKSAIIIGGGLALSSTAIVLRELEETKSTSNKVGRLSIAILLLQDLAVVPLLVLTPLLAGGNESGGLLAPILQALTKAFFALMVIFITGRLIIRPFFNMIVSTKNDELFIATNLLVVLGTAYITNYFNLSMALGAFVAGLLVAETEYCHEVEQVILPFKKLLLGLFFMAIGMSIDLHLLGIHLLLIVMLAFALMLIKAAIIISLCLLFKCQKSATIKAGLMLSQGGEFAFILFNLDAAKGIIPEDIGQILMAVVTVSMALTPFFSRIGSRLENLVGEREQNKTIEQILNNESIDIDHHVIIAGFGRVGQMAAEVLAEEQMNYIAIDINSNLVTKSQDKGFAVYLGDITNIKILAAMQIERAIAVIITVSDKSIAKRAIKLIKESYPEVKIVVKVSDLNDSFSYYEIGADKLVPENYETGLQLGASTLLLAGFGSSAISILKDRFRKGNYSIAKFTKQK